MSNRLSEIKDQQFRIRFAADQEGRRLTSYEKRFLAGLNREAVRLECAADEARRNAPVRERGPSVVHGPAPRADHTYPASMRPGARGND